MSNTGQVSPVKANPKKIITILLVGTLATVFLLGLPLIVSNQRALSRLNDEYHQLRVALGSVQFLEHRLKLLIEVGVLEGDPEAHERYDAVRKTLDEDISHILKNTAGDFFLQSSSLALSTRVNDPPEAGVWMLLEEGKVAEAREALSSPEYRAAFHDRMRQIAEAAGRLDSLEMEAMGTLGLITHQGAAILVVIAVLLLGVWIRGLGAFNQYEAERNAVEFALMDSQERFRALIENLPVGVYRLTPGPNGRFVAANEAMARIFGHETVEDFLNCDPRALYADDAERKELGRQLIQKGRVRGFQLRLHRKDGSVIWGAISANLIHDSLGRILYVDGMEEDISERKRAEENLLASEERYRLLAQNAQDVIWLVDTNLRWTYLSPAIEDLLGYSVEEAMRQQLQDLLTPEGYEKARRTLQSGFKRIEKEGDAGTAAPLRMELQMRRKDGSLRWVEINMVFLRNEHGRVVGIQGSTRDAHKRKLAEEALLKSERLYRGIIETTDEGVWMMDEENRITFVNGKVCEMFGCEAADILGRTHYEFMDDESRPVARRNEDLRRGGSKTHSDLRFRRKDGSLFWAMVSASPVPGESGDYSGTLMMISDITIRKRAEEAIRESEERYRLLAENARDVIITTDMALNLTYVSPAIEPLTGYSPRETGSKQLQDILTPESFLAARNAMTEEIEAERRPGSDPHRSRTLELELVARGGARVWTEIKVSFLRDSSGHPVGIQGSLRDITERRRVELALRNSEELYRGIIETTDEGVWILDAADRTTFVNSRTAQMLGYKVDEMTGRRIFDFLDEVGHQIHRASDQHRRKGIKTHNDLKILRKDGTEMWAIVSASPSFTDDGQYTGALAMLTDITERKRAEEGSRILAAVSSLFLAGKDIAMAINTVVEMCGEFDGADRAFVYLLDRSAGQFGCTHEWCRDGVRSHQAAASSLTISGHEWLLGQLERGQSVMISNLDSTPAVVRDFLRSVEVRSRITFPIFILGHFEGFCGFDSVTRPRDWTPSDTSVLRQTAELIARGIERKRAEEALRNSESLYTSLVEHLEQSVVRKDRQGRITFANSKYCQLARLPADEILGRTVRDLYPGEIGAKIDENDRRVMDTATPYEAVEEFTLPTGKTFYLHIHKSPVRDSHGNIVGMQAVMWDISKQKQAEEALLAASRLEATATLAGGIAHDFNNLMVGILGNAEILQFKLTDREDLQKRLKTISTAARRGGDLAHQLLDFARGGKTQTSEVALAHTIEEALQIQHRAVPPTLEIITDVEPSLWTIPADPLQMTQVVMNLCINAIEASEGGGRITVRARNMIADDAFLARHRGLKSGPHVHLSVTDTGCGMTPEVIARVFEPFFTTKFQGRGLGLAAVYGIVRNHKGWIGVESEPGKGSTFNVYLPATLSAPGGERQRDREPPVPETLLIVDDDEMILDVNRLLLEQAGFRIVTAGDGLEALRILGAPDSAIKLVLLDLTLRAGMTGRDLFFRIREEFPEVRVLLHSGHPEDTTTRDLLRHGASGYLAKPVKSDILFTEIRRALSEPPMAGFPHNRPVLTAAPPPGSSSVRQ